MVKRLLAIAAMLGASAAPTAQSLLVDIDPRPNEGSSDAASIVDLDGIALFVATSGIGRELWRSDGTAAGTWPVLDIAPGAESSRIRDLTAIGTVAWFVARSDDAAEFALWRTDGTPAGTSPVFRPDDPSRPRNPGNLVAVGDRLWFTASDPLRGTELWTLTDTPGESAVFDIWPGSTSSLPAELTVDGDRLYFSASGPIFGQELYVVDSGDAAPRLVANLNPGSAGSRPRELTPVADLLFLIADAGQTRPRLIRTDGTGTGTGVVPLPQNGTPSNLAAFGASVLFAFDDGTTGPEPWIVEPPYDRPRLLADLEPGPIGSGPTGFIAVGDAAVFAARTQALGDELWRTDGTTAGTFPIGDLHVGTRGSGPAGFLAAFGGVVFTADDGSSGRELWITDGKPAGTRPIADLAAGPASSRPAGIARVGPRLFFAADLPFVGNEICVSDGTAAGTRLVANLNAPGFSSSPEEFTPFADGAAFRARAGIEGRELFVSDGTAAGTMRLDAGIGEALPYAMTPFAGRLWCAGRVNGFGNELLVSDGRTLRLALDLFPGPLSSDPMELTVLGGRLWFAADDGSGAGSEPSVSDGTRAGTRRLGDLRPGLASSEPRDFVDVPGGVAFLARTANNDLALWGTDGTATPTELLPVVQPRGASPPFSALVDAGDVAYFVADTPLLGRELWRTDGTVTGTRVVADIVPHSVGSQPRNVRALANGGAVFTAREAATGFELYFSDGTAPGTRRVSDIGPGSRDALIDDLVTLDDRALFLAANDDLGRELWVADGTPTGTRLVRDLYPGPASGAVRLSLVALPDLGLVAFAGSDGHSGLQIWISDGTSAGTRRAGTLGPRDGIGAAVIAGITSAADRLWFAADDGATGLEPWTLDLATAGIAFARRYGAGCAAPGSPAPRILAPRSPLLGATDLPIGLADATPNGLAFLAVATTAGDAPLGPCRLWITQPFIELGTVATDADGRAWSSLLIPSDPALLGAELFGQWFTAAPGGPWLGAVALSDAVRLKLGY